MFGKNHLFTYEKLGDIWDELDEICLGNYDEHPEYQKAFSSFELDPNHGYNITSRLTDEAIAFINRMAQTDEQPFFTWVNYQDPHPAFTCPQPYKDLFDPNTVELPKSFRDFDTEKQPIRNQVWRKHSDMEACSDEDMRNAIATYMGQIRLVDDSVGRMMDALEESGQMDNTIILFFSDHGELIGDHGMTHKIPAFYDCLSRIPVILKHPDGRWANTTFGGLTEEIDLVPTLLESVGIKPPATMVGKSWKADLDANNTLGKETILCEAGGGAPTWKEPIEGYCIKAPQLPTSLGPGAMLRKGDWKITIYHDDRCELYNVQKDPHEMQNLFEDPAFKEIRDELTLLLSKRLLGVKVRDVGMNWPESEGNVDVRFESLHKKGIFKDRQETTPNYSPPKSD